MQRNMLLALVFVACLPAVLLQGVPDAQINLQLQIYGTQLVPFDSSKAQIVAQGLVNLLNDGTSTSQISIANEGQIANGPSSLGNDQPGVLLGVQIQTQQGRAQSEIDRIYNSLFNGQLQTQWGQLRLQSSGVNVTSDGISGLTAPAVSAAAPAPAAYRLGSAPAPSALASSSPAAPAPAPSRSVAAPAPAPARTQAAAVPAPAPSTSAAAPAPALTRAQTAAAPTPGPAPSPAAAARSPAAPAPAPAPGGTPTGLAATLLLAGQQLSAPLSQEQQQGLVRALAQALNGMNIRQDQISVTNVTSLAQAQSAPAFQVLGASRRRLHQGPSGVQASVLVNAAASQLPAIQSMLQAAISDGAFQQALTSNGVPVSAVASADPSRAPAGALYGPPPAPAPENLPAAPAPAPLPSAEAPAPLAAAPSPLPVAEAPAPLAAAPAPAPAASAELASAPAPSPELAVAALRPAQAAPAPAPAGLGLLGALAALAPAPAPGEQAAALQAPAPAPEAALHVLSQPEAPAPAPTAELLPPLAAAVAPAPAVELTPVSAAALAPGPEAAALPEAAPAPAPEAALLPLAEPAESAPAPAPEAALLPLAEPAESAPAPGPEAALLPLAESAEPAPAPAPTAAALAFPAEAAPAPAPEQPEPLVAPAPAPEAELLPAVAATLRSAPAPAPQPGRIAPAPAPVLAPQPGHVAPAPAPGRLAMAPAPAPLAAAPAPAQALAVPAPAPMLVANGPAPAPQPARGSAPLVAPAPAPMSPAVLATNLVLSGLNLGSGTLNASQAAGIKQAVLQILPPGYSANDITIGNVQSLAQAAPAPAFSISGRRLQQASPSGAQLQLLINTAPGQQQAVEQALQQAISSGSLQQALNSNGVPVQGVATSSPNQTPSQELQATGTNITSGSITAPGAVPSPAPASPSPSPAASSPSMAPAVATPSSPSPSSSSSPSGSGSGSTQARSASGSSGGFPLWAIAPIVVGALLAIAAVALAVWCCAIRPRRQRKRREADYVNKYFANVNKTNMTGPGADAALAGGGLAGLQQQLRSDSMSSTNSMTRNPMLLVAPSRGASATGAGFTRTASGNLLRSNSATSRDGTLPVPLTAAINAAIARTNDDAVSVASDRSDPRISRGGPGSLRSSSAHRVPLGPRASAAQGPNPMLRTASGHSLPGAPGGLVRSTSGQSMEGMRRQGSFGAVSRTSSGSGAAGLMAPRDPNAPLAAGNGSMLPMRQPRSTSAERSNLGRQQDVNALTGLTTKPNWVRGKVNKPNLAVLDTR